MWSLLTADGARGRISRTHLIGGRKREGQGGASGQRRHLVGEGWGVTCTVHLCLDILSTSVVRTLCYLPSLLSLSVSFLLSLQFSPSSLLSFRPVSCSLPGS